MKKLGEVLQNLNNPEIVVNSMYGIVVIDKNTARDISSGQIEDLEVSDGLSIRNVKERLLLDDVHLVGNSLYCNII